MASKIGDFLQPNWLKIQFTGGLIVISVGSFILRSISFGNQCYPMKSPLVGVFLNFLTFGCIPPCVINTLKQHFITFLVSELAYLYLLSCVLALIYVKLKDYRARQKEKIKAGEDKTRPK